MVKEVVKHTSFRYKLCIACMLIAAIIFMIRLYTVTKPGVLESGSSGDPSESYLSDPLDILYVEDNLSALDHKDPQLIQYTRIRHLTPPSKLEYNFRGKGSFKDSFSEWVAEFFNNKRDGVFIEAGTYQGEESSHTLYLEKELGWTGLVAECNPTVVPYLKSLHRKAWIADVCFSPTSNPATLNLSNPTNSTYSGNFEKLGNLPVPFDIQAIPLYTILAALGWKEVDYFSFHIEGRELAVLKNFPFDLVTFKLLIIEVNFYNEDQRKELNDLLTSNSYIFVRDLKHDKIYVHSSVKHLIPL